MTARVRVLVVHRGLLHRRDDTLEVEGHLVGLVQAAEERGDMEVLAADGHTVFTPLVDGEEVTYLPVAGFLRYLARHRVHVGYVHMPVPVVHLVVAAVLRLRGAVVLFAPMAMLDDEYARAGWYRARSPLSATGKRAAVRVLRVTWRLVARWFVCLSEEEVRAAHLPAVRCLLAPWALPPSPLGRAVVAARWSPADRDRGAQEARPAAFVGRFDVARKGLDRLASWVLANEDALPHPAVILFAPPGDAPPELQRAIERGLVRWDDATIGADLVAPLLRCRASMLLSRWEAQPRSLREAMVLGMPVLTTRPNHLLEAMQAAGAGETVDGDDPMEIQDAYRRLAKARPDAEVARAVFDGRRIGAFLADAVVALGRGDPPPSMDGYRRPSTAVADAADGGPRAEVRT